MTFMTFYGHEDEDLLVVEYFTVSIPLLTPTTLLRNVAVPRPYPNHTFKKCGGPWALAFTTL